MIFKADIKIRVQEIIDRQTTSPTILFDTGHYRSITVVVGWMISVRTSLAPRVTVRGVVSSVVRVTTRVTASVTSEVERMAGGWPWYRLAKLATGCSEGTILTALKCVDIMMDSWTKA